MMDSDKVSKLEGLAYFIDLARFQEAGRSFVAIAWHCLCSACQERLTSELKDLEAASLIANISDCCSEISGFVNPGLPVLEKIFRLLLSKGNEPLSLAELVTQLTLYSDNPALLSAKTLKCLMDGDQYYGFNQRSGMK